MNDITGYEENLKVKHVTFSDMEPIYIDDLPGVLDDLGLSEVRKMMDKQHNRIISEKYSLAVWMQTPGIYPEEKAPKVSPFEAVRNKAAQPQPASVTAEEIQRAIDAQSITDPEYREAAKNYLASVLPALRAKNAELIANLSKAKEDLAKITRQYKAEVNKAEAELLAFNSGVLAEYIKFETANEGSRTAENHKVTSNNCQPLVRYVTASRYEKYTLLEAVQKVIDRLEDLDALEKDPERINSLARENSRKRATILKNGGSSPGKIGIPVKGKNLGMLFKR